MLRAIALAFLTAFVATASLAQSPSAEPRVRIPSFWDPKIRPERPEAGPPRIVRFLTDDEFPPLHFASPDGGLTGFSVEIARAVCEKLAWTCTMQARRFDTLTDSLARNQGDVLAAGLAVSPALRERFAATQVYFRSPARFVTIRGRENDALDANALRGRRVAVVAGTAHAAFLEGLMPFVQRREAPDLAAAIALLRNGDADHLFGDGLTLSVLLASDAGAEYAFTGGPYFESAYFGEGIAFVTRRDDPALLRGIDWALRAIWEDGTYARLFLRFFPVSPF